MMKRVIALLILVTGAAAAQTVDPPIATGDILELGRGEYVTAFHRPALGGDLAREFGISFWFRVDELPRMPFQQRVLLAKPGSWLITIQQRYDFGLLAPPDQTFPVAWSSLRLYLYRWTDEGIERDDLLRDIEPGVWTHISAQRWNIRKSQRHTVAINGTQRGNGTRTSEQELPDVFVDARRPLYVGDIPRNEIEGLDELDLPYDLYLSSPVWIDELRIGRAPLDVGSHLEPAREDETTVAIWHFDEGRDAPRYADAVGNHTLRLNTLAVEAKSRLATSWAALKATR